MHKPRKEIIKGAKTSGPEKAKGLLEYRSGSGSSRLVGACSMPAGFLRARVRKQWTARLRGCEQIFTFMAMKCNLGQLQFFFVDEDGRTEHNS
jgi:hypothetical protein